MKPSLPTPVSTYFDISNGGNIADVADCFTHDAVVVDEGRTYRGHLAIQKWQREAQEKFEYSVEPIGVSSEGDRLTVTARLVGNFPGSPVELDHVFELGEGRISALTIG